MARPKKIQHFTLKPFLNAAGTQSWRVAGTKADGTRVRQNFPEKSEAVQTHADLEADIQGHAVTSRVQGTRLSADQLADAEAGLQNAGERKIADMIAHYLNLEMRAKSKGLILVTHGVRSHPDHGEDSPLYRSMGFVPKSERGSGLTRRSSAGGGPPAGNDEVAA